MPDGFLNVHRAPIISAAARNKVPAVYAYSYFARDGGLLSYEPDQVDAFRRAASYVDRILRGERPGVARHEHADAPHAVALLRVRRQRPRRRAAEERDERAPSNHSIIELLSLEST
jgi:hypothetical protein